MAKKKTEDKKPETLESYLCRTQGIGVMLAKDVVKKMDSKIRVNLENLIISGKPAAEVFAAMKPAPVPGPEPEPPKTPTE